MVLFPLCKINLGLSVLSKRSDGFHNIETCFYPVPWTDILEIIPGDKPAFTFSGSPISGKAEDNLCGAGLGGGSSDAAATLKTLNEIFSLRIDKERLRSYASQLGSDCAFFIEPGPMLGRGKGEILTSLPMSLKGKFLVLVTPDVHVSTAEAYGGVTLRKTKISVKEILAEPVGEWKDKLVNDFEASVFLAHPILMHIKQRFYELGALYASMSGSGSAVFGLFDEVKDSENAFPGIKVWSGMLS